MKSSAILVFATLLLTVPQTARSQAQDSTQRMVPAELVELLWGPGMWGGRTELLVGELPEELASAADVGANARVVGSTRSRAFTLGAVVMAGDRQAVREAWDAKLLAAGWTPHEEPREVEGGFARDVPETGLARAYCSPDDRMLNVTTRARSGDSVVVMLVLSGEVGMSPCGLDVQSSVRMRGLDSPVPTLRAPVDAQQRGGGGGGGGGEWDSHARLRTDLDPGALLGHYAIQLLEQGWQPVTQSVADDVAIHVSRKTDDDGVAWQAVLYVTLAADGERDLYLRVTGGRR
jgi:hypothetical protein